MEWAHRKEVGRCHAPNSLAKAKEMREERSHGEFLSMEMAQLLRGLQEPERREW